MHRNKRLELSVVCLNALSVILSSSRPSRVCCGTKSSTEADLELREPSFILTTSTPTNIVVLVDEERNQHAEKL